MHLRPWAFVALLVSLLAAGPLSADEVALRISLHQPAEGLLGQNLQEFKKMVEADTKGAVKVSIYDKASFYLDYQVPEGVSSGAIEMGVAPLAAYTDEIPPAGLFMQPFLFNFGAIVRAAASRGSEIRSLIDAEIEKKAGVKVLWWQPYGPNVVFGKGSLADPKAIVGRNVRVFDEISAKFISLCGGTPHIISDGKQAEAFDMNIVDSSVASVATVNDDELWRRVGTITKIGHSENLFLVIVNEATFKSLSPKDQERLLAAARKAEDSVWEKYRAFEAKTYEFAKSKGVKVQELSADDTIAWRVCSSSILESYMDQAGELGAQLFAAYGKLRTDPCCSSQAMGGEAPK
jgi:C4-dicarboxylate-binding protein DctP